ncbi:MAG: glycine cleavage system aminomethyltransferase GcvT [Candidatus Omnitrophica bacterium]|nr:glycine cleavage system aminomethyltransferase GcvT [Candidatus Omnitrophota bacterium]
MTTQDTLKKTPLYKDHVALNAKMVPFGGWDMPVQYEGILAEHHQTRHECSLFDISHMGEFIIEGDATALDGIVTMSIKDMPVQSCRYGMILNEQGGIIDDLIVFRLEQAKWFIVVNGATTAKDAAHFQKHLKGGTVFKDVSLATGKLDVQGPTARKILKTFVGDIDKLEYYKFDFFDLLGENVLISRTGYTGELGYEIYYPWDKTVELWNALLKAGDIKPAGLGARDVLRLEVGYSLYGHELEENISPLEAGLSKFIDFEKDFIGKDALLKEKEAGVKRKIVGLLSQNRRSPRADNTIYSEDGKAIGIVTSGTFSPILEKGIGLGFVDIACAQTGNIILFGNDKSRAEAAISSRIFYKEGSLKT